MLQNNCIQGSTEWLALRKGRISASKLPVIMGLSPYQTALQLWNEELGFTAPQECRPHMQRGLDIEQQARDWFFDKCGFEMKPDVVFHKDNPLFMASLDGICAYQTIDKPYKVILEIKNNNIEFHEKAKSDEIVEFHQAQMQWQMYCADALECFYLSWRDQDPVVVLVKRDDEFIERAKDAALEFLRCIADLEEPALTARDYVDYTQNHAINFIVSEYREYKNLEKHYAELAESAKKRLLEVTKERNAKGSDWKITRSNVKGRIDYDTILEQFNIDTSLCQKFRKPSTTSYRITLQ